MSVHERVQQTYGWEAEDATCVGDVAHSLGAERLDDSEIRDGELLIGFLRMPPYAVIICAARIGRRFFPIIRDPIIFPPWECDICFARFS
jgi:hypothetical protein